LELELLIIRTAKNDTPFVIYTTPIYEQGTSSTNILKQYKDFQDLFEKKNANIL